MTAKSITTNPRPRRRLPEIRLPNGRTLMPLDAFAHDIVGESARTARRKDYPITKIAGVSYVAVEDALQQIADSVHRRDEPKPRRRGQRVQQGNAR